MSERRFKSQITDVLTEQLPDSGALERWLAPTTESKVEQIPVEQIRDRGWRADVDTTDPTYRALKASIRASGVLQPLLLRPHPDGGFEVVSGARRLCAARETVQSTVPAVVRELTDVQALVGGSWDAVLRTGLSARESSDLVAQLVAAGMEEAQASALVGTAPVREDAEAEIAVEPEVVEAAGTEDSAAADAPVAEVAPVEAVGEVVVADEAEVGIEAHVEPDVVDVAEGVTEVEPDVADVAEAAADDELVVAEAEPVEAGAEPEVDPIAADFDADIAGWPAPDSEATRTAPTTPPAAIPVDPVVFPVPALESDNGVAAIEAPASDAPAAEAPATEPLAAEAPVADAPSAEAQGAEASVPEPAVAEVPDIEAPGAEPSAPSAPAAEAPDVEVAAVEPPVAETPAIDRAPLEPSGVAAPSAEAPAAGVAPEPEPAVEPERPSPSALSAEHSTSTITPHVIPIKLPEPAVAVPSEEPDGDDSDSLPVAAPTATGATSGSRLVNEPVPAVRMEPTTSSMRPAAALPSVLRRGPLFYAVLGIGLAVGAIVFILVTVVEGVGSGTTPIIAAVVVAVLGFVSAMISLAQPRERS